jgi:glycosyltransferase 2 family protein
MLELLRSMTRFVEARIGWSRIGTVASLMLVATAFIVLCTILREVGIAKVIAATRATPLQAVIVASGLVLFGYYTITLADYVALRALGRREVPYSTAAFAGFTAYAIGHGLGITLVTGAAVRLRVYSDWGLGLADVTKIGIITGLTFWLGNICALGFALVFVPDAAAVATLLPKWANQAIGFVALAGVAGYIAWLLPAERVVGVAGLRIALPNASQTFVQIAIGISDLAVGSLATYVLLPAAPSTDYVIVAVAYVMATLFGFLSHAPGSLGVFEVAMLILLPQYRKEELLGSLLILHVLYFVLPLAVALLMLAAREIRRARCRPRREQGIRRSPDLYSPNAPIGGPVYGDHGWPTS